MAENGIGVSVYSATAENIGFTVEDSAYYQSLLRRFSRAGAKVSYNKKSLIKRIDESWVSAVEAALPSVDTWMRNPGRDITEEEKILPVELSHSVNARTVRHLAQHTDMINRIDEDGSVVPSKLLNVFREENYLTYENKFVNTLIERLYVFVDRRLRALQEQGADEEADCMTVELDMSDKGLGLKMSLSVETTDKAFDMSPDDSDDGEDKNSLMRRVRRIMKTLEAYKASQFCAKLGKNYIRPPIMRTNAIMKNIYLKQCLVLWQYIESYDKAGFEIISEDTAARPPKELVRQMFSLLAMEYVVFRYSTRKDLPEEDGIGTDRVKIVPKIVRRHDELSKDDFDISLRTDRPAYRVEAPVPVVTGAAPGKLTERDREVRKALANALTLEKREKAARLRAEAAAAKKAAEKAAKAAAKEAARAAKANVSASGKGRHKA